MKRMFIVGLILFFSLGHTIRGTEQPCNNTNMPLHSKTTILVIPKSIERPFWKAVKRGAQKAADDYNLKMIYEGPEIETDAAKQLEILKSNLAKKPQAIVLAAIDSKAVKPYLEEAQETNIPVISFDTGVDSPIVKTTIATDNYEAGVLAAKKMAELINGQGKVGVIVYDQTSQSGINRRDGFIDTIQYDYPNIQLIPTQYSGTDIKKVEEITKNILKEHPDLQGLFGTTDFISLGIINAVKALNKTDQVTIIGFDSVKALGDSIREGVLAGAIAQNPFEMGYKAVEAAFKEYKGEILPSFIDTGFTWYDKSNIDNPDIQNLLYE
ncbi:MAG: sugar transporter, periplasmic ligand binding protein [Clostridia bacterium]|jgi:ribose transport system substrate-binding protein|nr:sugar transporter, periplasmic ligand binding protein [Clostridia bacterium]